MSRVALFILIFHKELGCLKEVCLSQQYNVNYLHCTTSYYSRF